MNKESISIFWIRRDLRWDDNTGLYAALDGEHPVLPLFIFDTRILDDLETRDDARVNFLHQTLEEMNTAIADKGASILVKHGKPEKVWNSLLDTYDIRSVYFNRDYEPYARERDQHITELLEGNAIAVHTFRDHVIKEPDEVLKDDGDPYVVFTPYSKKWLDSLNDEDLQSVPSALYFDNFVKEKHDLPSLSSMGFSKSGLPIPGKNVSDQLLDSYGDKRNFPAAEGTSRMGVHLRFGTVSIRKLASQAREHSKTYLNELIWREFYQQILWHFPRVVQENFHKKYDALRWRNNADEFEKWCKGNTGYPIVDAGMRELNETGYMHNRVRMIVASFLTKHLLIDWRWGEAYFAKKLLDYELASNNGGWQWAAGTGTDAQPYFRIFNPYSQTDKFDKDHRYIRKWVPEFDSDDYAEPIVEHKAARERALDRYKEAVG